jgi:CBS domain containing-hemolysin-like protein
MELSSFLGLGAVAVLVAANGFFVATEFAIVAVRRSRLEQLAAEGNAGAQGATQVVRRLDTYIAACQLGITMASLALGWVGEPALAHLVEPPLEALIGTFAHGAAEGVAVGVSFAVITALHIVAGELAPKGLALQRPEATAIFVARPMRLFELVFRWPIAFLNGIGNGVLHLFGLHAAGGHEAVHGVEELRLLVAGSQRAGMVEASEARIASRAFTFADLTAGALMTPRTEVEGVPLGISPDVLLERLSATSHHRLPVFEESLDTIVGVLNVMDCYRALIASDGTRQGGAAFDPFDLRTLVRPVVAVPESKPADALLDEMRTSGRYFAVVLDEYGGTAGIVTLEDLMEALVGTMAPDADALAGTNGAPQPAATAADGSLLVDGLTRLEEWEDLARTRLAPEDHEAVETLGGLVMTRLGRIPETGDEIAVAGGRLRVEQMDGRRVAQLRFVPTVAEGASEPGTVGTVETTAAP